MPSHRKPHFCIHYDIPKWVGGWRKNACKYISEAIGLSYGHFQKDRSLYSSVLCEMIAQGGCLAVKMLSLLRPVTRLRRETRYSCVPNKAQNESRSWHVIAHVV